jgi:tetratricopeptide (TPR) repeat protein
MSSRKQGDIYSGPGDQEEQPKVAKTPTTDHWRRDYLKNKFWSFTLGLIVFIFIAGLTWMLIQNFLSMQPENTASRTSEIARRSSVVSGHRLSILTDWVIDFNEPLDFDVKDAEFNTTWLKRATYHLINGEQAYRDQKPELAREHLNKALKIFPNLKGINFLLGNLALMEENYDASVKFYELAMTEGDVTYQIAGNLGAACIGAEQYEKAEKYLLQAQKLQSNAPEAYKNLAILYRKKGDVQAASDHFEKYLNLSPNDLDVTQSYAMYMIANQRWQKASDLLTQLNRELPNVSNLFFLRAQVESQLGNSGAAMTALKRGIKLVDSSLALAWLSNDDFDLLRTSTEFQELATEVEIGAKQN